MNIAAGVSGADGLVSGVLRSDLQMSIMTRYTSKYLALRFLNGALNRDQYGNRSPDRCKEVKNINI